MVAIIQIIYFLFFLTMLFMGVFIIYHITAYSYTLFSKILTLLIFVPVLCILLFTNMVIFYQIPVGEIFSGLVSF